MAGKIIRQLPEFKQIHERLRNVQIENLDYRDCIIDYDDDDMVFYCDPPYIGVHPNTYDYEQINHERFLNLVFKSNGFFAVSGYPNELYDSYPWDDKYTWDDIKMVQALAYSDKNYRSGKEGQFTRETSQEVLYIKEAHDRDWETIV